MHLERAVLTMMAAFTAVLLALSASARGQGSSRGKPRLGRPHHAVGCEVLGLPSEVTVGEAHPIVRIPRYSGPWWSPTITTVVEVAGVEVASEVISFQGTVTSNLYNTSILIPEGSYISGSEVLVSVSVEEPQNFAECSAVSTLVLAPAP